MHEVTQTEYNYTTVFIKNDNSSLFLRRAARFQAKYIG